MEENDISKNSAGQKRVDQAGVSRSGEEGLPDSSAGAFPEQRTASIQNNLRLLTAAALILASLAIGYTFYALSSVMVPLVIAFVLTYLVQPLVGFFRDRLRLGHVFGVIFSMVVVAGVMALVGYIIVYSVSEGINRWPVYENRFNELIGSSMDWLRQHGLVDNTSFARKVTTFLTSSGGLVMGTFGKVLGWAGSIFTVMLFVFFMLLGRPLGDNSSRSSLVSEIDDKVKTYLLVKTIMSLVTGVLVGVSLGIIGLDLAILFGVLAFLLNFIPTFGSIVATLLPFVLALVQFDNVVQPALVLLIPLAVQITVGNVMEPRVMGEKFDIHPVVILFSLVLWWLIWGLPGMLMAAPLTAVLKIVFSHIDTMKPVARIIEGRIP